MKHVAAPNSLHVRAAIDDGKTGDKSPGLDPAAAPLGTDEEAADTPATPHEVASAVRQERSSLPTDGNAASPAATPAGGTQSGHSVVALALFAGITLLTVGIMFAVW